MIIAADWNAGRVDLGVARVCHVSSAFVSTKGGHDIAAHSVGGKVEDISVSPGGEDNGIGRVGLNFTSDEVSRDDSFGVTINDDEVEHFGAGVHFDSPFCDFF